MRRTVAFISFLSASPNHASLAVSENITMKIEQRGRCAARKKRLVRPSVMRPRETIAMALIGWILLIAPRKYQSLCPYFDVDAPLHEWTSKGGFTAKVDCEGARRLFLDPVFRECWSLRYPPEHARANNNP